MTPALYRTLAGRLGPVRRGLWQAVAIGLVLALGSVLAADVVDRVLPHALSFALGLMLLILGWGGLMAVFWFGPGGSLAADTLARLEGAERRLRGGLAWYAAVVLSVWLLAGVLLLPLMMWRVWAPG